MRQKFFLLFVLLCAAAQGAWADDGWSSASSYDKDSDADKPTHYDTYGGRSDVHVIKTAANYLYVMDKPADYCSKNIYLDINVDVSSKTWINLDYILGVHRYMESWGSGYRGTFYGNGHTIRINLDYDSYGSYKGPFGIIAKGGKVQDLNVEGTIYLKKMDDGNGTDLVGGICGENNGTIENCSVSASVSSEENYLGGITGRNTSTGIISNCRVSGNVSSSSRLVGGIAGENNGTISNCWVSGNVSSDWKNSSVAAKAKVGGIAGENNSTVEYCCMTGNVTNNDADVGGIAGDNVDGTIKHCTFYGTRSSDHSQDNLYAGDSGTEDNCYDGFNTGEWDAAKANGHDLYAYAIKYPYAINVTTVGQGSVTVSAGGEDNIPGARHQQEVTLTTPSGLNADVTVTDADGNNVTLFGSSGASGYTFIMRRPYVNVHVIFSVPDWPRQGSGTSDSPYLITSADDWNEFALSVNAGNNHSGQYVKLTKDINIWMMAGASVDCSFQGTFDGDGHTMTFNPTNTNAVTAPFRFTKNATIKNLRTAGSITTEAMNAAGIVGDVTGSLDLTNCSSAVTISSSRADGDYHGGLVASNKGSVTISGCVFDGSFVATVAHTNQYGTTFCGGLVGMSNVNTSTTITNSLVAPTSVSEGMVSNTFVGYSDGSSTLNITNSYFVATTNLPGNEGTQAVAAATATANLGDLVQDYGMVKAYQNGIFYDGTYYMVPATLSGNGTELAPYTISSLYEWNSFAYHVNNGTTFSGKTVKLTEDISVVTMAGVSETSGFRGTFDGAGHTLTFNATGQTEKFIAPFRCVGGSATIKNLQTAGCISTSNMYATGLIASIEKSNENSPSITVENCRSSMAINNSGSGDMAISGLVGRIEGATLTIRGCVFDGSLVGRGATGNAGFVSWTAPNSNVTIEDCLFVPTNISTSTDQCATIARKDDDASAVSTIINCYYTQAYGTEQGKQAYTAATTPANLGSEVQDYGMVKAYQNGILFDGKYYVAPASISLANAADNSTTINDADGYVATVTLTGRTLYKDGAWNTLCLPFNVNNFTGTPLEDATVKTLASTSFSGGTLTMNFSDDLTSIKAGKPYIVKWAAGTSIVDPVFNGVTISDAPANAETSYVDFVGTYSPVSIYTAEKTNLYLGADNTLYYPTATDFKVNACRAYFKLNGLTAGEITSGAIELNFGEDEATGILTTNYTNDTNSDAWFTLDGRKIDGKPTQRGIYVNNGKKVAIK